MVTTWFWSGGGSRVHSTAFVQRRLGSDWALVVDALRIKGFPIIHDGRDEGSMLFEMDSCEILLDQEGNELTAHLFRFPDGRNSEDLDETGSDPLEQVRDFVEALDGMIQGVVNG